MSGKGYVTTARGELLDFDSLVMKSKQKPGTDVKASVKKRNVPTGPTNKVRGHKLTAGAAQPETKTDETEVETNATTDEKSLADYTSVKVRTKKNKKEGNDAVEEILSDLNK